jgi:hypothetical protein
VPRVLVTRDDGEVYWNESVKAADFEGEHFRSCLAERLGWAVADAEGPAHTHVRPVRPAPLPGGAAADKIARPPAEAVAA